MPRVRFRTSICVSGKYFSRPTKPCQRRDKNLRTLFRPEIGHFAPDFRGVLTKLDRRPGENGRNIHWGKVQRSSGGNVAPSVGSIFGTKSGANPETLPKHSQSRFRSCRFRTVGDSQSRIPEPLTELCQPQKHCPHAYKSDKSISAAQHINFISPKKAENWGPQNP